MVFALLLAQAVNADTDSIPSPGSDQSVLDAAVTQWEQGQAAAAELTLKSGLQKQPEDAELHFLLGRLYLDHKMGEAAEAELRLALSTGMPEQSVTYHLGRAYILQGDFDRLLKEIRPRSDMSPSQRARVLVVHALANLAMGELSLARRNVLTARNLDTHFSEARLVQARLDLASGQPRLLEPAAATLSDLLKDDPQCMECWELMGEVHQSLGNSEAARNAYEQALSLDSGNLLAHLGILISDLDTGQSANVVRHNRAAKAIKELQQHHPDNPMLAYLSASLAYKTGNLDQALIQIEQAVKGMPDHLPSLLLQGILNTEHPKGDRGLARRLLRRVLSQQPDKLLARKALARLELNEGRASAVVSVLEPLGAQISEDTEAQALLGTAYMNLGDTQAAQPLLDAAALQFPDIRIQQAAADISLGNIDRAITELKRATQDTNQINSQNHRQNRTQDHSQADDSVHYVLIIAQLYASRYAAALDTVSGVLASLTEDQTPSVELINLRGSALLGLERFDAARTAFERALTIQPDYAPAQLNLARLDLLEDKSDQASDQLTKLIEEAGSSPSAKAAAALQLARLKADQGHYRSSMTLLDQVLDNETRPSAMLIPGLILIENRLARRELDQAMATARRLSNALPDHPDVIRALGRVQLAMKSYSSALAQFNRLVELDPDSAQDHFYLAQTYTASRRYDEAEAAFHQVLRLKRGHLQASTELARMLASNQRADDAAKLLKRLVRRYPLKAAPQELLGDIYLLAGDTARARVAYHKAARLEPNTQRLLKAYQNRRPDIPITNAIQPLRDWAKKHPRDSQIQLFLAGELEQHQDQMEGDQDAKIMALYESILKREPGNVIALNNLAMRSLGKDDAIALAYADVAYAHAPEDGVVLDTYGQALLNNGQAAEAVTILHKAADLLRREGMVRYHYALALKEAGKPTQARDQLRRLLITFRDFPMRDEAKRLLQTLRKPVEKPVSGTAE